MSQQEFVGQIEQQEPIDLLERLPQVVVRRHTGSNFIDKNNNWFIDPQSLPMQMKKLLFEANSKFSKQQYIQASTAFRKAKLINEYYRNSHITLNINVGLAICFSRLGMTQSAIPLVQHAISQLNRLLAKEKYVHLKPTNYFASSPQFYETITKKYINRRLRTRMHLFLCILKSQIKNHKQAYNCAFNALKDAYLSSAELTVIFMSKYLRQVYLNNSRNGSLVRKRFFSTFQEPQPEKPVNQQELQEKLNLVSRLLRLLALQEQLKRQQMPKTLNEIITSQSAACRKCSPSLSLISQLQQRKNLETAPVHSQLQQQLLKTKMIDLIQLHKVDPGKLHLKHVAIENERVTEAALIIAISCYCLSTESRFKKSTESDDHQLSEGEHWLSKSMEVCHGFIPNSLVFSQVYSIYHSLHAVQAQTIPQDQLQEQDYYVKVLKPLDRFSGTKMYAPLVIRKLRYLPKQTIPNQNDLQNQLDAYALRKNVGKKQEQLQQLTTIYTKNLRVKLSRPHTQRESLSNYRRPSLDSPLQQQKGLFKKPRIHQSFKIRSPKNLIAPFQKRFTFSSQKSRNISSENWPGRYQEMQKLKQQLFY